MLPPREAPDPLFGHVPALGDRSLFPTLGPRAYLNHAAISPPSRAVCLAVQSVLDDYAREGLGALPTWLAQRQRLRGALASLVGARPQDVAMVGGTTQGVIAIALCYPWRSGDRILVFEGDFPANVTPWQRAAELFGLEVRSAPFEALGRGEEGLAEVEAQLDGVRLVAVSAVQFSTGLRVPLEKIAPLCHARGAELFVDGVQACGAVPVDVGCGVDYLTCGAHKWLMGLEGCGFLYVSPARVGSLRPTLAGWLSHVDAPRFLSDGPGHLRYDRPIRGTIDFLESGAPNHVGGAALEAAVAALLALGVDAIHAHVDRYLDLLEPHLLDRGFRSLRSSDPALRSGILGVLPPAGVDVRPLPRRLAQHGVAASIPDGVLRFAPHWPNHPDEIPDVLREQG